jgi:hypothetical protein
MKKQIKKLSLGKKTISNLLPSEMANRIGGSYLTVCTRGYNTCFGKTCNKHCTF